MPTVSISDSAYNDFNGRDTDSAHEELEAQYEAWERRENDRAIADADEAQAVAAMPDESDLDCLREAARLAREFADAAVAEADRLEEMVARHTSQTIADGNIAIMEKILDLLD